MRTLKIGRVAGAILVVPLVVVACARGGGMKMEPEPEPLSLSLVGTWRTTDTWTTDDGEARTAVDLLTFVGDRAVNTTTIYDGANDVLGNWFLASGWEEIDDTTITRFWFEDFTEDDVHNPTHGSVEKSYHWGNAEHSVLFLHQWGSPYTSGEAYHRYERVALDTLPSPVGAWRYESRDDVYELTIGLDGSFVFAHTEEDGIVWRLTGVGVLNLEDYTIALTGLEYSETDASGVVTFGPETWHDGVGRVAFAPFDRGYAVSTPWDERDEPYGFYWLFFEPAEQ